MVPMTIATIALSLTEVLADAYVDYFGIRPCPSDHMPRALLQRSPSE